MSTYTGEKWNNGIREEYFLILAEYLNGNSLRITVSLLLAIWNFVWVKPTTTESINVRHPAIYSSQLHHELHIDFHIIHKDHMPKHMMDVAVFLSYSLFTTLIEDQVKRVLLLYLSTNILMLAMQWKDQARSCIWTIFYTSDLLLGEKSWVDFYHAVAQGDHLIGLVVDEAQCIKDGKQQCIVIQLCTISKLQAFTLTCVPMLYCYHWGK